MKTTHNIAKKGLYIGTAAGLGLFAVAGLLTGSFLGGVIGLNIASGLLGGAVDGSALARVIVGASMVLGVLTAGVVFVVGGSTIGWLLGTAVEAIKAGHVKGAEVLAK